MPEYGDCNYWDKRYQDSENKPFDWLQNYKSLKPVLEKICTKTSKILMLGCGNALLSEDMYKDGYHYIYNIDISTSVIEQMRVRNKDLTEMKYEVMDCTELKYASSFFDVIIDKSTIDALLCGSDPDFSVAKMTKEVQRVLKTAGVYCVISYGNPENRLSYLNMPHLAFEIEQSELTKPESNSKNTSIHYVYNCRKLVVADNISKENWEKVEKQILFGSESLQNPFKKYLYKVENQLEELSVSKNNYLYEGDLKEDSDDDEFLTRIGVGDLCNAEITQYLENVKKEIETVGKTSC